MPTIRENLKRILKASGVDIEDNLKNFKPTKRKTSSSHRTPKNIKQISYLKPEATSIISESTDTSSMVKKTPKEAVGFVREDLLLYDLFSLSSLEDERDLIVALKIVLSDKDVEALSIAMTIKRFELNGQDKQALKLKVKLRQNYGERGNRINNFYSTGLLTEFLDFAITSLLYTPTATEKTNVKKIFNKCIDYQEYAIFVNSSMNETRIISELVQRFNTGEINIVLVFAKTIPLIERIETSIKKFLKKEKDADEKYQVKRETYKIGKIYAGTFIIEKKES